MPIPLVVLKKLFLLPSICLLLIACSSSKELKQPSDQSVDDSLRYSIIYLIHGDANYVYHTGEGKRRQADEKVLADAKSVAKKAKHGEVFIFHQRPERKILWLFPRKDRHFYHYKNGRLIREESYSPSQEAGVFNSETALLDAYRSPQESTRHFLLYFGHEIPIRSGKGYYSSLPKLNMNVNTFTSGTHNLLDNEATYYDMMVLSTCNNGSPDMAANLADQTQVLLASPQNLHLSHIDTEALNGLELDPEIPSDSLAADIAKNSFQRLESSLQTVVSLSVYNMDEVRSYIQQVDSAYQSYLSSAKTPLEGSENIDCTSLPFAGKFPKLEEGVQVWYRPPRFGKNAKQHTHSGWGCKDVDVALNADTEF